MKVVKIVLTVCGIFLLLCSILAGGIFYMLSNDVVHDFQYYKVEDTHTWDDKNWTLILVRNRDNATVLKSVLDYYSEDDNEVLVVTLDGYYIFLGETLVYSETYNGVILKECGQRSILLNEERYYFQNTGNRVGKGG